VQQAVPLVQLEEDSKTLLTQKRAFAVEQLSAVNMVQLEELTLTARKWSSKVPCPLAGNLGELVPELLHQLGVQHVIHLSSFSLAQIVLITYAVLRLLLYSS